MADRVFVYFGALPQTADILNTNKFSMIGNSFLAQAALGSGGAVAGLACSPTSPASLVVSIGMGSIYQLDECDATAYGDLGADTTVFVKQGLLYAPKTLTVVPPSTSGYSQIFLVEAILDDIDAGTELISYYNSGNVNQPFAGPAGDGQSQFTTRTVTCAVALKAGVAAPTGSETTPTPDDGYVGLWTITVANGQSQITSANIAQYANAPFFPTLPAVPTGVQNGTWVGFDDSGVANAYVISPQPLVTALAKYQKFRVKIGNLNTGASTLTVNLLSGSSTAAIVMPGAHPLVGGELAQASIAEFIFDGVFFELESLPANLPRTLSQPLSLYVNGAAGSDSFNGLTSGTAFATIQHAMNVAAAYVSGANVITINIAAWGTVYAGVTTPQNSISPIVLSGAGASSTTIDGLSGVAVLCTGNNIVTVENMTIQATTGTTGVGVSSQYDGLLTVGAGVTFGICTGSHIYAGNFGIVQANTNFTLAGGGAHGAVLNSGGFGGINCIGCTITIPSAITVIGAFAQVASQAQIASNGVTFTGAGNVTGKRYAATLLSLIDTAGSGSTYFPGGTAGTADASSVYS